MDSDKVPAAVWMEASAWEILHGNYEVTVAEDEDWEDKDDDLIEDDEEDNDWDDDEDEDKEW